MRSSAMILESERTRLSSWEAREGLLRLISVIRRISKCGPPSAPLHLARRSLGDLLRRSLSVPFSLPFSASFDFIQSQYFAPFQLHLPSHVSRGFLSPSSPLSDARRASCSPPLLARFRYFSRES